MRYDLYRLNKKKGGDRNSWVVPLSSFRLLADR